jgi:nucleoside-diphosphate-sugar epimerase
MDNGFQINDNDIIISRHEPILITGANGFIGSRVVKTLQEYGFDNLRCLVRSTTKLSFNRDLTTMAGRPVINIIEGNLLSREDCRKATENVAIIYHLAAGRGEKSYPDAILNSVVTTRNLLESTLKNNKLKRFLNVSSFSVYSNELIKSGGLLDENCKMEKEPGLRGEAYCYAKVKQDELVIEYSNNHGIPVVIVRPGVVYGPGNKGITGRVGIDTFGIFMHLGGSNIIPLTYVDNCADAIVRAGLRKGIDGQIFNIIDDELPISKELLKLYKKEVASFKSIYIPKRISYFLCYLWEKYSEWSENQVPDLFNRKKWASYWKGNRYSNEKIKKALGWKQRIPFEEALKRYFEYQKEVILKND